MHGLHSSSKEQIHKLVENLFDKTALRFLGAHPKLKHKKIPLIGFEATIGLAALFVQAMSNKWLNNIEQDVLKGLVDGALSYIDNLKNKTSNDIIQKVEGMARRSRISGEKIVESELNKAVQEELSKATAHLEAIITSEGTKTRNLGMAMDITRAAAINGEKDPIIGFAVIRDASTCEVCIDLNLMPDGVTPRLYRMSELSAGYYKRGDKVPSLVGNHPHCFTGSQMIATDSGLISFKELFESKIEPKVLVDYRIKIRKDTGNQFGKDVPGNSWLDSHSKSYSRFEQATSVYDTGIQEVIRFTLDSGQEIEVSLGHEMWVETGNSIWSKIEAQKLVIGDKVPLVTNGESFGLDHFPIEAELMGNLLGDGNINEIDNRAQWNFFGNDIPYGEKLLSLAKDISSHFKFQDTLNIYPPNNKYNVSQARFKSEVLGTKFVKEFGLTKKPRRVPVRLFKANKKTVAAFLRGLYAADGHSEPANAVLAQNNLEFLKEIQLLLSMFGFVSRIFKHGEAHDKILTYSDGTKYLTHRKSCWRLVIGGAVQFNKFISEIGFGVPEKQKRAESNNMEKSLIRNYWRTAKIEKIEYIGLQQTYCLTEPMTNTVTVNGIVTGQCRCTPFNVPSDWGFNKEGHISYIGIGHNEFKKQRS